MAHSIRASFQATNSAIELQRKLCTDANKLSLTFQHLADRLDDTWDCTRRLEQFGTGVTVLSEVAGIVGLLLAPLTEGASLVLPELVVEPALAGELVDVTADFRERIVKSDAVREERLLWNEFRHKFVKLIPENLSDKEIKQEAEGIFGRQLGEDMSLTYLACVKNFLEIGLGHGSHAAEQIAVSTIAKSVGLNGFFFALGVHHYVKISAEIDHNEKSKLGSALRKLANELDKIAKHDPNPKPTVGIKHDIRDHAITIAPCLWNKVGKDTDE